MIDARAPGEGACVIHIPSPGGTQETTCLRNARGARNQSSAPRLCSAGLALTAPTSAGARSGRDRGAARLEPGYFAFVAPARKPRMVETSIGRRLMKFDFDDASANARKTVQRINLRGAPNFVALIVGKAGADSHANARAIDD
jgi:hypothetical protein